MKFFKSVLVVSMLVGFTLSPSSQSSREENMKAIESKLFEVGPAAAYRLKASHSGRGYNFCNTTNVRVAKFRLGCVKKQNGKLRILGERRLEDVDLAPKDDLTSCRFWTSNHGVFPGEACKQGKLAIVEVLLADGTTWKLGL